MDEEEVYLPLTLTPSHTLGEGTLSRPGLVPELLKLVCGLPPKYPLCLLV